MQQSRAESVIVILVEQQVTFLWESPPRECPHKVPGGCDLSLVDLSDIHATEVSGFHIVGVDLTRIKEQDCEIYHEKP